MTLRTALASGRDLAHAAWRDARLRFVEPVLPRRPRTISLLANDICNSRCTMCHIWKQKRDFEVTPDDLRKALRDPLFARVTHVGITGGEPTLRRDLPELYRAVCDSLPRLKGASVITNAIRPNDVIERIEAAHAVCREAGKSFSMMVSLDGVGAVHDLVRGREGNFDTALTVLRHFKQVPGLPVYIGCTITKQNVWHVDEVLDLARAEGVPVRFRVAEFIQRLYNLGQTTIIRNFDDDETYHLVGFFRKLERQYERAEAVRRTYRSIQQILLGGPRRTGCPYQSDAVVLDSRGELMYCSPKSKSLGSALKASAKALYTGQLAERQRIRKDDCAGCIHDYHAPPTTRELVDDLIARVSRSSLGIAQARWLSRVLPRRPGRAIGNAATPHILITGWYGTETVGDKAILGAIFADYRQRHPNARFTVSSLYPFVTERTLHELNEQAEVVPAYSRRFLATAAGADEVVMGGGPLMDLDELALPLASFALAAARGARRTVYGCGLGPLRQARCIDAVRRVLTLADDVTLRDRASLAEAQRLTGRTDLACTGDPAAAYVIARRDAIVDRQTITQADKPTLALFLREWPANYRGDLSLDDYFATRERFEQRLGEQVRQLCETLDLRPALYPMHRFFEGCDDRDFNRRFAAAHLQELDPYVEVRPASVDTIIRAMLGARLSVCMRFHSVLFAHTLGVEYVAIDYTLGGKIHGFLHDHEALARSVDLRGLADGSAGRLIDRVSQRVRGALEREKAA